MMTACPNPFLPPSCWDLTKVAGADATLAGLSATIAAAIIVLTLEATKESSFEQETRNTVLSILTSTFLCALLASFIFGLLTGEMPSIRANVLLNLATPALIVAALQFMLSIGWLLTSHQAATATLGIARLAFLLISGLAILHLYLGLDDLLALTAPRVFSGWVYNTAGIIGTIIIGVTVWLIARRKQKFLEKVSKRKQKGTDYAHLCAKSALFFAAGSTLFFGVISRFSASLLQSCPAWVYYLGAISLMALMGWFIYICEMSWPPLPSAHSPLPQENHIEETLDDTLSGEAIDPSEKKHSTNEAEAQQSIKNKKNDLSQPTKNSEVFSGKSMAASRIPLLTIVIILPIITSAISILINYVANKRNTSGIK